MTIQRAPVTTQRYSSHYPDRLTAGSTTCYITGEGGGGEEELTCTGRGQAGYSSSAVPGLRRWREDECKNIDCTHRKLQVELGNSDRQLRDGMR